MRLLMSYGKEGDYLTRTLRVWECLAKVVVPTPKRIKVGPKTINCIFIGYAHNSCVSVSGA
jgi:hypothetical protein